METRVCRCDLAPVWVDVRVSLQFRLVSSKSTPGPDSGLDASVRTRLPYHVRPGGELRRLSGGLLPSAIGSAARWRHPRLVVEGGISARPVGRPFGTCVGAHGLERVSGDIPGCIRAAWGARAVLAHRAGPLLKCLISDGDHGSAGGGCSLHWVRSSCWSWCIGGS